MTTIHQGLCALGRRFRCPSSNRATTDTQTIIHANRTVARQSWPGWGILKTSRGLNNCKGLCDWTCSSLKGLYQRNIPENVRGVLRAPFSLIADCTTGAALGGIGGYLATTIGGAVIGGLMMGPAGIPIGVAAATPFVHVGVIGGAATGGSLVGSYKLFFKPLTKLVIGMCKHEETLVNQLNRQSARA